MTEGYLPYKDQTRHYFNRPSEGVLDHALEVPAAWYGRALKEQQDWISTFRPKELAEIEAALDKLEGDDRDLRDLTAVDFPLPLLSSKIAFWRDELQLGRGFQVLRGLPVERWSQDRAERFFWCLGLHFGRPGGQNPQGDLLGHVTDVGKSSANTLERLYKTSANIEYHCDGADVVGLLCLRKAKEGGQSRIVSSVSVFNELVKRRPDLTERLFSPVKLDIRNENKNGQRNYIEVTPCQYAKGVLRTFYHADYFRSVVRHPEVGSLAQQEQDLFDQYEALAGNPDLYLDMDLQPGDIQLLSNHTNLHARTDYIDHEDPSQKRHLLRLWLSL